MKKKKILIIFLLLITNFFLNIENIMAKTEKANLTSTGKCSKYFKIRSTSVYGEKTSNLANTGCTKVHQAYEEGKLKSFKYVDGKAVCDSKINEELDKSDKVTTAWYYQTENKESISKKASLTIDVYSSGQKVCSDTITGFDTDKKTVKIALQHDKLLQSVNLKGTFKNNDSTVSSEIALKIVESTTTTELNTEAGTKKGKVNQDVVKTSVDAEGNTIIVSNGTSCTDVRNLIHDYWKYVKIIVPVLLIVMMVLDFFKALSSNDSDAINKAASNAFKRTIAAVILLALPALLGLILGWFGIPLCI